MKQQFVNEYQKNVHELDSLFNSLDNWDKGKFIEKNLKYLDYTKHGHYDNWKYLEETDVLAYIDNAPNILDIIKDRYNLD